MKIWTKLIVAAALGIVSLQTHALSGKTWSDLNGKFFRSADIGNYYSPGCWLQLTVDAKTLTVSTSIVSGWWKSWYEIAGQQDPCLANSDLRKFQCPNLNPSSPCKELDTENAATISISAAGHLVITDGEDPADLSPIDRVSPLNGFNIGDLIPYTVTFEFMNGDPGNLTLEDAPGPNSFHLYGKVADIFSDGTVMIIDDSEGTAGDAIALDSGIVKVSLSKKDIGEVDCVPAICKGDLVNVETPDKTYKNLRVDHVFANGQVGLAIPAHNPHTVVPTTAVKKVSR